MKARRLVLPLALVAFGGSAYAGTATYKAMRVAEEARSRAQRALLEKQDALLARLAGQIRGAAAWRESGYESQAREWWYDSRHAFEAKVRTAELLSDARETLRELDRAGASEGLRERLRTEVCALVADPDFQYHFSPSTLDWALEELFHPTLASGINVDDIASARVDLEAIDQEERRLGWLNEETRARTRALIGRFESEHAREPEECRETCMEASRRHERAVLDACDRSRREGHEKLRRVIEQFGTAEDRKMLDKEDAEDERLLRADAEYQKKLEQRGAEHVENVRRVLDEYVRTRDPELLKQVTPGAN
jgi:hypothetical protein